jgi:hypothetical protein
VEGVGVDRDDRGAELASVRDALALVLLGGTKVEKRFNLTSWAAAAGILGTIVAAPPFH